MAEAGARYRIGDTTSAGGGLRGCASTVVVSGGPGAGGGAGAGWLVRAGWAPARWPLRESRLGRKEVDRRAAEEDSGGLRSRRAMVASANSGEREEEEDP